MATKITLYRNVTNTLTVTGVVTSGGSPLPNYTVTGTLNDPTGSPVATFTNVTFTDNNDGTFSYKAHKNTFSPPVGSYTLVVDGVDNNGDGFRVIKKVSVLDWNL